jgi:hypothetical protein
VEEFKKQFVPSEAAGTTVGVVGGGPVDELKPDVGWERIGEEAPEPEPGEGESGENQAESG